MKLEEGPAPQQEVRPDSRSASTALRSHIVQRNAKPRKSLAQHSVLNLYVVGAIAAGLAASYLLVHVAVRLLGLDVSYVPGIWVLSLCALAVVNTIWMVRG